MPDVRRLRAPGKTGLVAPGAILLAAALLLLASCTSGGGGAPATPEPPATPQDGVLTVRAFEWGFAPESIALRRGEPVRIVFQNDGKIFHNLKIEELAADAIESRSTGPLSADEGELFVGADGGEQGELSFVPQESGAFVFYCTVGDHRQRGMEGTLRVE